jgi:hypothetical protein
MASAGRAQGTAKEAENGRKNEHFKHKIIFGVQKKIKLLR